RRRRAGGVEGKTGMSRVLGGCRLLMAAARAGTKEVAATPAAVSAAASKPKVGLLKPRPISPAMKKFLGVPEISRIEAVKKIWEHIKANQLQVIALAGTLCTGYAPSDSTILKFSMMEKLSELFTLIIVNFLMLLARLSLCKISMFFHRGCSTWVHMSLFFFYFYLARSGSLSKLSLVSDISPMSETGHIYSVR
ncbi:unnamed protein product, partial [Musa textilis]